MTLTSHDALRSAISARTNHHCPTCSQDTWAAGNRLVELGDGDGGPPIEALAFVCTTCGYVRLHAIQALQTIDD